MGCHTWCHRRTTRSLEDLKNEALNHVNEGIKMYHEENEEGKKWFDSFGDFLEESNRRIEEINNNNLYCIAHNLDGLWRAYKGNLYEDVSSNYEDKRKDITFFHDPFRTDFKDENGDGINF